MSGIYIHIPFCRQSCIYCNFYFKNGRRLVPEYLDALLKEIDLRLNEIALPVRTLYLGGGTPSILNADELNLILEALKNKVDLSKLDEFTLEANPDDMSLENLKVWKSLGVTRLSVGVQSFFDEHLKWMNRAHNASEAENALKLASELGFDLSLDIIFGIPGSTNEQLIQNLSKAISFNIQHISCYGLTLEDKTPWKKLIATKSYSKPDDAQGAEQFKLTMDFLRSNGWIQYEISNYCLPGKEARHNSSYWRNETYVGLGPSAHSYDGTKRCWNISDIKFYVDSLNQGVLPMECETLSQSDKFNEYILTSLRTIWGVHAKGIENLGVDSKPTLERLNHYVSKGMLSMEDGVFTLTDKGKFYADAIASDLFIA